MIKFAIVGCGVIGNIHAECISRIPEAKLVSVFNGSEEKARILGNKYNCSYYTDLDIMLENEEIDAVSICTPSGFHGEHGIKCAKAKKNIICEKPIETTEEKAMELISVCENEGVKLSVISQHRFDNGIIELKRAIDNGELGKLQFGESHTKWFRSQDYYDSGKWRGTLKLDGGGALINQSIHYIDLLQYLMGPVEEIYGVCTSIGHKRIEVEDEAVATVRFKNGAIGLIEGNTNAYPGFYARLDIYGEKASVVIENDKVIFWESRDGSKRDLKLINGEDCTYASANSASDLNLASHIKQFKDFIEAIEKDRAPKIDGYEGLKTLRIIRSIYESNRTKKPVTLCD